MQAVWYFSYTCPEVSSYCAVVAISISPLTTPIFTGILNLQAPTDSPKQTKNRKILRLFRDYSETSLFRFRVGTDTVSTLLEIGKSLVNSDSEYVNTHSPLTNCWVFDVHCLPLHFTSCHLQLAFIFKELLAAKTINFSCFVVSRSWLASTVRIIILGINRNGWWEMTRSVECEFEIFR